MAAPGPQQLPHGAMLAAARDYVEKSNRGEVPACLSMFAADAVYGSSTVGGHEGLEAITAMMTGFFGKFPAVHWQVEEYLVSKDYPNCVEFLFVRTGVLNGQGENTRQHGKEWICFTTAASTDCPPAISRVIVETFSTEVCPTT